jgi:hypothetical protein
MMETDATAGYRKPFLESFDGAQDERRGLHDVDDFPFMLRLSKHS